MERPFSKSNPSFRDRQKKKSLGIKVNDFLYFFDRCRSVSEIGAGRELPNKKYKWLSLSKGKAVHTICNDA